MSKNSENPGSKSVKNLNQPNEIKKKKKKKDVFEKPKKSYEKIKKAKFRKAGCQNFTRIKINIICLHKL